MKLIRLDKLIATHTSYSRSEVARLIKAKQILIDGKVASSPAQKVADTVQITIADQALDLITAQNNFVIFHKPKGYICANEDSIHATIFDILPDEFKQMHSIGRLDLDTTGLLFLTNDGKISHQLSSPKHHVAKTYRVWLEEPIEADYQEKLATGLQLHGEKALTLPAKLEVVDDYCADITISEGRYHQVKRMFAALGNKVIELHRYRIGNYELPTDLAEGEYLQLPVNQALALILD